MTITTLLDAGNSDDDAHAVEETPHLQDHAREQVIENSDGVLGLVIGRDGNVHIGQSGVCVAEGNGWDVHVGRLLDGLVVCARVCHNQQPRLLKVLLNLVGEGACVTEHTLM